MQLFDISYVAILKIMGAGIFTYIIFPLFLVARDLILLKAIEKLILTSKLQFNIRICESDRWQLNNRYNKKRSIEYRKNGEVIYTLDGDEVNEKSYKDYENTYNMHYSRFILFDAMIGSRHNLIISLTKHYKSDDFKSPIPELSELEYQSCESQNA